MAKVKKAEAGVGLRKGQYKRLGRIAENNPDRADKVADRMKERATREQRGKRVAQSSGSRASYAPKDILNSLNKEDREMSKKMSMREGAVKNPVKRLRAKDGKSFPDLNKDGKITKADILKGRGVIAKKGAKVKKAQAGLTASNKRVGPIDPKGAWTKVQEMTIAGKKTPVSLKKDKQLGATKMKSGGKMKKKK